MLKIAQGIRRVGARTEANQRAECVCIWVIGGLLQRVVGVSDCGLRGLLRSKVDCRNLVRGKILVRDCKGDVVFVAFGTVPAPAKNVARLTPWLLVSSARLRPPNNSGFVGL